MTTGPRKTIPDPGFAGDSGAADPVLLAALDAFEVGQADARTVEGIVATSRLLVPVVAVLAAEEVAPDGLRHDKQADMAMVTIAGKDGRRGLPVFSSVAALQAWSGEARPVPVDAARAARAAIDDGAEALLVDPSPRPRFVVAGERLALMAAGVHNRTGPAV
jgi:hypothetical protein